MVFLMASAKNPSINDLILYCKSKAIDIQLITDHDTYFHAISFDGFLRSTLDLTKTLIVLRLRVFVGY